MKSLSASRFIVGLILIAASIALLVFTEGDSYTTGAIALSVLGLVSIAISRRRRG